jgi:hypothetical protein
MPHNYSKRAKGFVLLPLLVFFTAVSLTQAANLRVAWDASADSNVVGYKVAYGTTSGLYNQTVNAGNSTSATVPSLTPSTTYYFVVKAYNSIGLESLPSNEVAVTTAANIPPSVSLTNPQAGASFQGSTPISMTATASDADGSVVKVEFYQDSNKIGQATAAPYSATWNNAPTGNFVLTALAYDDSGAAVRSAGARITVGSATPGSSPTAANKIKPMSLTPIVRAGSVARFKLVASAAADQPMTVNYSVSGTATAGVDYAAATGQVTIPAGARSIAMPVQTNSGSGRKTMVLTVMPGNGYTPGRVNAVVRILGH